MKRINPKTLEGKRHVHRGGNAFVVLKINCRSARRTGFSPLDAGATLGLRIVLKHN